MRLKRIFFSLIFLLHLTVFTVLAQSSPVSATGHVIAEIVPVYSATETSQLNFGRFSPGPQGGLVIITPQSTMSVVGGVFKGVGSFNAASFYLSGDVDAAFSVSLPPGPVILKHVSSARTMIVQDWVSIPQQGIGTGMLQNGSQTIFVGATLKVGPITDNPVGIYTGTYQITFDFN